MNLRLKCILSILLLFCAANCSSVETAGFQGKVTDALTGETLAGVEITATANVDIVELKDRATLSATTNSAGVFSISNALPSTVYTLVVESSYVYDRMDVLTPAKGQTRDCGTLFVAKPPVSEGIFLYNKERKAWREIMKKSEVEAKFLELERRTRGAHRYADFLTGAYYFEPSKDPFTGFSTPKGSVVLNEEPIIGVVGLERLVGQQYEPTGRNYRVSTKLRLCLAPLWHLPAETRRLGLSPQASIPDGFYLTMENLGRPERFGENEARFLTNSIGPLQFGRIRSVADNYYCIYLSFNDGFLPKDVLGSDSLPDELALLSKAFIFRVAN